MPQAVIFSDQESLEEGLRYLKSAGLRPEILQVPEFALGLVSDVLVLPGEKRIDPEDLRNRGVQVCGAVPYYKSRREIPQAASMDPLWGEVIGDLRIMSIRKSLTDPDKLHVEMATALDLGLLIPIMARMIRGGVFHPEGPLLAFEEEHRLIGASGRTIWISRADDLLDFWIVLRTMVELIVSAWDGQHRVEPETQPRQGIGTVEIFRRLPGENCGQCRRPTCMEFATGLLTGTCTVDECIPIMKGDPQHLESLRWVLRVIGLDRTRSD
ncbi:MAG: (Fe-S)-binding protein [Thermodesulfobacteriota bacterium]